MEDQGGKLDQGNRNSTYESRLSLQDKIWNGLSPRNRQNQEHYQRVRKSQPLYEDGEYSEIETNAPSKKKRLASQELGHEYPAKRMMRLGEPFDDLRTSYRRYSPSEHSLPPLIEDTPQGSSWMGPEIRGGEIWGSGGRREFEQMSSWQTPRRFTDDSQRREQRVYGDDHRNASSCPRAMNTTVKYCYDYLDHKGQVTASPKGRQSFQGQKIVDLTTPESLLGKRQADRSSTHSGSSTLKRNPPTEPTEIEYSCDSDIQGYKSARLRQYIPMSQMEDEKYDMIRSRIRQQSIRPDNRNRYVSQVGQSLYHGNQSNCGFSHDDSRRQSQNVSSLPLKYKSNGISLFEPAIRSEDTYLQSSLQGPLHEQLYSKFHRRTDSYDNPESDEDDTLEDTMRKKTLQKRARAAKNASRDILSKRVDFGGSLHNASGHSSQENESCRTREKSQNNTLSRIRGSDSSKGITQVGFNKKSAQPLDIDSSRYMATSQAAAQKAVTTEKEKLEERRQKLALDAIIQKETQAKKFQEIDCLFDDCSVDKVTEDRIILAKVTAKAKMFAAEKAKIVEEHDKKLSEDLAAAQKRQLEDVQEEYNMNKQKRLEEKRKQDKKIEEERLDAKRKSAYEKIRLSSLKQEEARLERMNKLETEKQASKLRAATLQPVKKTASKSKLISNTSHAGESRTAEDSGNESDDCMFVSVDAASASDALVTEQPVINTDGGSPDKLVSGHLPETGSADEDSAVGLVASATEIEPKSQAIAETSVAQNTEVCVAKGECSITTEESSTNTAETSSNRADLSSTIADSSTVTKVSVGGERELVACKAANVSTITEPAVEVVQAKATVVGSTSISDIASDGRRRTPVSSKPTVTHHIFPDPVRFVAGGHTAQNTKDSTRQVSDTFKKFSGSLNEEWKAGMKKLAKTLTQQDRQKIARDHKRASFEKARNIKSNPKEGNHSLPPANNSKILSQTSNIEFHSQIESQQGEEQKTRKEKLAKYEKDKAGRRKRYERDIRQVLTGQGIELEDDKILKQVDEKMVIWEQNRRKKERRENGGKDLFTSAWSQDTSASDVNQNHNAQPKSSNTIDDSLIDPVLLKEQQRMQAMREGVEFLASQNRGGNNFAKAASKSRIQDLESDESEEDPDDLPESQVTGNTYQMAKKNAEGTAEDSADNIPEEMSGINHDETLNLAALDLSIIPPLPEIPTQHKPSTAFLPDIVNPKEEDLVHSYSVRYRAGRGNDVYDSVIIGNFHSLEEANAFAQQKLAEFYLGPGTGKSETHDGENLYVGQVTTNKDENHEETVWVTREIVYIGDAANINRSDVRPIIVPKVYNVIQILQGEDGTYTGNVVATASIKALANKKAGELVLGLSKPIRPRMDSMAEYNNEVVPAIRAKLAEADAQDTTISIEGMIPDTERHYSVSISENPVVGPLN